MLQYTGNHFWDISHSVRSVKHRVDSVGHRVNSAGWVGSVRHRVGFVCSVRHRAGWFGNWHRFCFVDYLYLSSTRCQLCFDLHFGLCRVHFDREVIITCYPCTTSAESLVWKSWCSRECVTWLRKLNYNFDYILNLLTNLVNNMEITY